MRIKLRHRLRRKPLPDYLTVLENYGPRKRKDGGMRSVVRVTDSSSSSSRIMSATAEEDDRDLEFQVRFGIGFE